MILSTPNQAHNGRRPGSYCGEVDPKYLYLDSPERAHKAASIQYSGDDSGGHGLEQLMSQRREILHSKIGMLVSEIYQRRNLMEENLYRIDLDQCACRNLINLLSGDRGQLDFERKIIELEQEKRKEQASYFRDILLLKKELRETLIETLEDRQKAAIFTDQPEGWT